MKRTHVYMSKLWGNWNTPISFLFWTGLDLIVYCLYTLVVLLAVLLCEQWLPDLMEFWLDHTVHTVNKQSTWTYRTYKYTKT